jgi:hypothetical protein
VASRWGENHSKVLDARSKNTTCGWKDYHERHARLGTPGGTLWKCADTVIWVGVLTGAQRASTWWQGTPPWSGRVGDLRGQAREEHVWCPGPTRHVWWGRGTRTGWADQCARVGGTPWHHAERASVLSSPNLTGSPAGPCADGSLLCVCSRPSGSVWCPQPDGALHHTYQLAPSGRSPSHTHPRTRLPPHPQGLPRCWSFLGTPSAPGGGQPQQEMDIISRQTRHMQHICLRPYRMFRRHPIPYNQQGQLHHRCYT